MPDIFLDREQELAALERAWEAAGPALILVWGRRRTGKTRLLGRFVEGKRAIFYASTEQSEAEELGGFSQAVRDALEPAGTDLLAHGDFPSWDAALGYLAERARRERLAVVIDEFPYLVGSSPALPSIVQRFWDREAPDTKLHLVLCGSAVSTMEELQRDRAPLFGRIDVRLQLQPFGYRDAARFVPSLSPSERAICYGVLGGMPTYLQRWRDDVGHAANLRALFADPTSPLIEEGQYVLSSELPEGSGYFRILRAIAAGNQTYGSIKSFADIDIQRQLDRLQSLGLVEREVPVTEDPSKTKRAIYRIADNFLAFWFRFVYRHRADIARGLGRDVVDRVILPGLSDHMGGRWEEMTRAFIRDEAARGSLPVNVSSVGRWWNAESTVEIDIVGLDGKQVVLAGASKWSRSVDRRELGRLRRLIEALPNRSEDVRLVLAAREEIRDVPVSEAISVTAADLYGDV